MKILSHSFWSFGHLAPVPVEAHQQINLVECRQWHHPFAPPRISMACVSIALFIRVNELFGAFSRAAGRLMETHRDTWMEGLWALLGHSAARSRPCRTILGMRCVHHPISLFRSTESRMSLRAARTSPASALHRQASRVSVCSLLIAHCCATSGLSYLLRPSQQVPRQRGMSCSLL